METPDPFGEALPVLETPRLRQRWNLYDACTSTTRVPLRRVYLYDAWCDSALYGLLRPGFDGA